jgi:hypothetical protein
MQVLPVTQWQARLSQKANENPDSKIFETLAGLYIGESSSPRESCFSETFNFGDGYFPMLDTLYSADVRCGNINRETIKRYLGYLVAEGFVVKPNCKAHGLLTTKN